MYRRYRKAGLQDVLAAYLYESNVEFGYGQPLKAPNLEKFTLNEERPDITATAPHGIRLKHVIFKVNLKVTMFLLGGPEHRYHGIGYHSNNGINRNFYVVLLSVTFAQITAAADKCVGTSDDVDGSGFTENYTTKNLITTTQKEGIVVGALRLSWYPILYALSFDTMSVLNISFYVLLLSVALAQFGTAAVSDSECKDLSDDIDGATCE
ncbi:hypothetical protein BD769DRAFT_1395532 [Suillus cothurnatus]|nr:hypothetical protein BD769DRAFT_1395532 [Suillus cothurnatus]